MTVPNIVWQMRCKSLLRQIEQRPDRDYIYQRADYYNRMNKIVHLPADSLHEKAKTSYHFRDAIRKFRPNTFHKAYYFDLQEVMRYFNPNLRIGYVPGDVYFTPQFPAIVKSRLLREDNENSVLLKLDKLRHFMFVKDPIPFSAKKPQAIFRGKIRYSRIREGFMQRFFGSTICDCGIVGDEKGYPVEWTTPKKTIREHLDYMFIMALEGNDVASNLKWVMSSNSIAVMTKPTCETWFMEGKLKPDYHYIEIKDDFSDLEDKLTYYAQHPKEAEAIIAHANEYVRQFMDKKRERLIALLVAEKYLQMTGQL